MESSDRDTSAKVPYKKKSLTDFLLARKNKVKKNPSIKVTSITGCCVIRMEFLRSIINCLAQKLLWRKV